MLFHTPNIVLASRSSFFSNFSPDFLQILKVVHIWIRNFRQGYSPYFVKIIILKIYLPVLLC